MRSMSNPGTAGRKRGMAMILTLLMVGTLPLMGASVMTTAMNHGRLTDYYFSDLEAFLSAEYGAAEGATWLLRQAGLPTSEVTVFEDERLGDQGTFTVRIKPVASYYVIHSEGTSGATTRVVEESVRVTAAAAGPERTADFTLGHGEHDGPPAFGSGPGFEFRGWKRRSHPPYQVYWTFNSVESTFGNEGASFLLIKFTDPVTGAFDPLTPGMYSLDVEARYTPNTPGCNQCPTGRHVEGFTAYVSSANYQKIGDPDIDNAYERFIWYNNMGGRNVSNIDTCPQVVNCGEGNFEVVDEPNPVYIDVNNDGIYDDLDGSGEDLDNDGYPDPDDIRGLVVLVPRNYDTSNYVSGSLHFKQFRLRQVIEGELQIDIMGWISDPRH